MTLFKTDSWLSGDIKTDCTNQDVLGLCPKVYYSISEDKIEVLGSDLAEAAAGLGKGLDPLAIVEEMALSFELGNRTLFSDVKRLLPWERMIRQKGKFVVEPLPVGDAPSSILDVLSDQVVAAFQDGVALELTSGLDSRLLLAAGLRRGVKPKLAFTIGDGSSEDVLVASKIADYFDFPHITLPLQVNEDRIRQDTIDFVRATGYAVNASCYAWIPGTLSVLDSERSAQMTGLVGELAGSFYYTPFDSMIELMSLGRTWVKYRLMRPGLGWKDLWESGSSRGLELSLMEEALQAVNKHHGSWRERTDLFYKYERIRRWALPVLDASNRYYTVVAPLLSPEYCAWALALSVQERPNRNPQRELLRQAHPRLADFRKPKQVGTSNPTASLTSKVIRRLRQKKRPSALGALESARALGRDREVSDCILAMAHESCIGLKLKCVEDIVARPSENPEMFGTLLTVGMAWRDMCRFRMSGSLSKEVREEI